MSRREFYLGKNRSLKTSRLGAFSLIELLVSMAILALLALLLLNLTNSVTQMWRDMTGVIVQWQSARTGFESMTRKISQATLNTTWAYFDGPNGTGGLTTSDPRSYGRYSELQFVSGSATALLPNIPNTTTQAIFFQAPLGQTSHSELHSLPLLLNACGYFIQFNNLANFRPNNSAIFSENRAQDEYRFRLMELEEPSENLSVYSSSEETAFSWFQNRLVDQGLNRGARPLAENIIALIILPKLSTLDSETDSAIAPEYFYNSRKNFEFLNLASGTHGRTLHQLPPLLQITMVALDDRSALRLAKEFDRSMPAGLFDNANFSDANRYMEDLLQLEKNLMDRRLRYRIFSSVIAIRGAKWNED